MSNGSDKRDEAMRRFMRRVWREDVMPLLRDKHASRRKKTARWGGRVAATGGLLIDSVMRLRGKPFTRFMTVMGSSLGAMLPDVWDWKWFSRVAEPRDREVVAEQVREKAAKLEYEEALTLFGLAGDATREQLKAAHRQASKRWHPDRAADDETREEYHVRFLAYQAAYEQLDRAFDAGRLPR